jgi:hypothetical protein
VFSSYLPATTYTWIPPCVKLSHRAFSQTPEVPPYFGTSFNVPTKGAAEQFGTAGRQQRGEG